MAFQILYSENSFQQIDKLVEAEKNTLAQMEIFDQTRRNYGIPGVVIDRTSKEGMDNLENALLLGRRIGLMGALYDATKRLPGIRGLNYLMLTHDMSLRLQLVYPEAIKDVVQYARIEFGLAFESLFRHAREISMKVICGSNPKLDAMINGERVVIKNDLFEDTNPRVYKITKGLGNSGEIVATWRPFPDDDTETPRTAYCIELISESDAKKVLEMSARYYKSYLYHALVSFTFGRGMRNERLSILSEPIKKKD